MKARKSWKEKLLDGKDLPKIERISENQVKRWGKGTIAIPAPMEVDAIMKTVPEGRVITINQVRQRIADKHHATIGCPITTGLFTWIAANAADEDAKNGAKNITPYWRTLKEGGVLNDKYPGGIEQQAMLLEQEGHEIIQKGKKWIIADLEKSRVKA